MTDSAVNEITALPIHEGGIANATKEAKTITWVHLFVSFNLKTTKGLNELKILACSNALVNQKQYKWPLMTPQADH